MSRFNIRVYGLCLDDDRQKILICEEVIGGQRVKKFPGGGLEFGEGITECLRREFQEELNIEIGELAHFYTTEFYQKSAWDGSQVISIYYLVKLKFPLKTPYDNGNEYCYYLPMDSLMETVTLPIDLVVAEKLVANWQSR